MTTPVHLSQADAAAKIQQIESSRDQAVSKLGQIADAQEQMLRSSWHGDSAASYEQVSQAQREEFGKLIATLNTVVDKGSEHIRAVANMDQG